MSTSSDGIHYYGLCWDLDGGLDGARASEDCDDYEGDEGDEGDNDIPDMLCAALGGPKKHAWNEVTKDFDGDLRTYWAARDTFLVNTLGVAVKDVLHCSYNCPM